MAKNLKHGLQRIYRIIDKEELCKLDAEIIDNISDDFEEVLSIIQRPDLRTNEKIMPVLYEYVRGEIINPDYKRYYYNQNKMGETLTLSQ